MSIAIQSPPARRSLRRALSAGCALLAALIAFASAGAPVRAAGDASDVVVDVVDAATGAPVALARVVIQGEAAAIGYTDADGRARFESVATGSYRASVVKRGFVAARSPLFDVVLNRSANVRVRLQKAGTLKQIGGVSVTSSPARASRELGQDDALRFLDGSLRDALGDLPGLTSAGDGLQIDGNDASQTGTSIDGVAIPGVGGSLTDRGINADLFGGASVDSGARNGSLAGNVGFRTLQPTRFAQQQATLQYGSDDASAGLFVARGSVNNLGYVLEHAVRGLTSPFTGAQFFDETGLSYRHDGDRLTAGDLVKLRWSPSIAQTLTLTATSTTARTGLACAQFTALVPCGYGPDAFAHARGSLVTLSENATIGATTLTVGGFANASRDVSDESRRLLAGVPAPQSQDFRADARGFNVGLQLPAGERHDLSLSAQSYGIAFDGSQTTALGTFALAQRSSFHAASVTDRIRPNQRLTVTARAGVNGGNGGDAFAAGLGVRWQPTRATAFDLAASGGDTGSGLVVSGTAFPDPRSLAFDCANGVASGDLPSANAPRQRSSALRGAVEHSGRRGRVALTAWSAHLTGAPVLTAFDGAALGVTGAYASSVAALASSPYVCGSSAIRSLAFTSFQPADQINRGATLAGTLEIGKALLAGYVSVQSRFVTAATPATAAFSPVGAQVPGTPLHRAGLVATAKLGRVVDLLANASYTAANNPNRLSAYTVFNAGFAAPLRAGSIAIVGTNLGNTHAGRFAGADALALTRTAGAPLLLAATPLAPRAVTLTYTVRTGRLGATGSGAQRADASDAQNEGEHGTRIMIRATEMRDGPHPDALAIDPDNEECTPVSARLARSVMDAVGRIAAAAERAKSGERYPAALTGGHAVVNGVVLDYTPFDGGARYAVVTAVTPRNGVALLNCAHLSAPRDGDRERYHLYVPPAPLKGAFFIAYAPNVGLYLMPPGDAQRGAARVEVSTEDVPAAPPGDPFAQRPAPACPASSKPLADALVAAVRAARDARRAGTAPLAADVADVVARGTAQRGWLELQPHDAFAQIAALQCLHVAGVPRARLQAEGIDDARRPGALGFADRFGFYLIAGGNGASGAAPSPAPDRTPGASP